MSRPLRSKEEVAAVLKTHAHWPRAALLKLYGSRILRHPYFSEMVQDGHLALVEAAHAWDGKRPFVPYAQMCLYGLLRTSMKRHSSVSGKRYKTSYFADGDFIGNQRSWDEPIFGQSNGKNRKSLREVVPDESPRAQVEERAEVADLRRLIKKLKPRLSHNTAPEKRERDVAMFLEYLARGRDVQQVEFAERHGVTRQRVSILFQQMEKRLEKFQLELAREAA